MEQKVWHLLDTPLLWNIWSGREISRPGVHLLRSCYVELSHFGFASRKVSLPELTVNRESHQPAYCSPSLRAVRVIINRVTPVINMLIPASVPIAQAELNGHCIQIKKPKRNVPIPSKRIQPDPRNLRILKYATKSIAASARKKIPMTRVRVTTPSSG